MKLIVGLGNPGSKYDGTKHNVGFDLVDLLAKRFNIEVAKKECQALTGIFYEAGEKVLLAKPQTFMNLSGNAVNELLHFYGDQIDDFLIIHDDLDLPVGHIRFKQKGSAGGHNGLKSIISHLNSNEFDRLKIGIDRKEPVINYVLTPFGKADRKLIDEAIAQGEEACLYWVKQGIYATMNQYN